MNGLYIRLATLSPVKVLILALAMTAAYYMVSYDDGTRTTKAIQKTKSEYAEQQKVAEEGEIALREVEKMRARLIDLGEQYKTVSQALPEQLSMSDVIRNIDGLAALAKVTVKAKEPKPTAIVGKYEQMPIEITVEGSYSEIVQFLYYVGTIDRIMTIGSFSVSSPSLSVNPLAKPDRLSFSGQIMSYKMVPVDQRKEETGADKSEGGSQ